ncbi:MAG: metalloregulator ArsR/SmtB family transcription factor [Candidatus Omnitrophica bacterium]|nr:metalloregulator ArsR/SmtB family transcription factor [Candidatus Omnitrophota bacterium]
MKGYLDLFKALSDGTRLRIMILLSAGELCVCQIESALGLSQVKVSRHLTVLRNTGFVNVRRDGLRIHYSIVKPKNCLEKKIFSCFRECLREEEFSRRDLSNMKKRVSKLQLASGR